MVREKTNIPDEFDQTLSSFTSISETQKKEIEVFKGMKTAKNHRRKLIDFESQRKEHGFKSIRNAQS